MHRWVDSFIYGFGFAIIAIGIIQLILIFFGSIITELNNFSGLDYFEKASSIFGLPLALFGIGLAMIYQIDSIERYERPTIEIYSCSFRENKQDAWLDLTGVISLKDTVRKPYTQYEERLDKLQQEITHIFKK